MEVSSGAEDGFVREWTPCSHILSLIPLRIQNGLFSNELYLTCVDVVTEYIALGTNVGLVYWYDRKKGTIQRLRCEASSSAITFVKIVNTVDYMVGAGNAAGQVTVFQIPKEHPDNIPDTLKPKVEPKVERYTIGDLHKSQITSIEWSKNGMRLFSGDKDGVIIMTEIDFYMHLCKSMEIVNEQHEIVQMSYHQNMLLVSSVYRSILCERKDGKWCVNQLGKKDRKSLSRLGGVFAHSYGRGEAARGVYCARPGLRLWRADCSGEVTHTLMFKDAISNPLTVVELLNPSPHRAEPSHNFGPLYVFRENFLVSHNERALYVLEPRSLTAVAVLDDLRRILSVSVTRDEIFILEGPRSLVRLAPAPDLPAAAADDPLNMMTKSLTSSLQQAVNTVRDLTHIDQTVPYIASVLEQPIAMFTKNEFVDTGIVGTAEECFELPPIKSLPSDISNNVLESIINEFKDVSSDAEEIRRLKSEEVERKLKLYNSIMEKKQEGDLIHSRRGRKKEISSGGSTPRFSTPVRKQSEVSYTTPCVMDVSVYGNLPQENDDLLEKQIEEKEKILAKMLNLESLSIKTTKTMEPKVDNTPIYQPDINEKHLTEPVEKPIPKTKKQAKKDLNPDELIPQIVQLPNTWNLENIELQLDLKANINANNLTSPEDHLENEWEFI